MPLPTLQGVTVNSVASALSIFYAVFLRILPKVDKRLDVDDRESLTSGDVYVWEERDLQLDAAEGIERWTDGIKWGSSRVRNEFLFYYERDHNPKEPQEVQDSRLIKQTFSVYLQAPGDPRNRPRKWHMVAYYTQATVGSLRKIEDIPQLATLQVPSGMFQPARAKRGHPRSTEPQSPTPIALARYPHSLPNSQAEAPNPLEPRARSIPQPPYSYASTSSEATYRAMTPDGHSHHLKRSRTPEPSSRPALLRRTLTSRSTSPRDDPDYPIQGVGRSRSEALRERMDSPLLPPLSNSYPPPELRDPRRVLPLPSLPPSNSFRRMPTDDKALNALQTQFMK